MTDAATESPSLPEGDYAIVELFGHQTLVGRIAEIERFGTKMIQVESIFRGALLPPVLHGGGAIYGLTPCSREIALKRSAQNDWELPTALRATLQPALPAPVDDNEIDVAEALHEEDEAREFDEEPAF